MLNLWYVQSIGPCALALIVLLSIVSEYIRRIRGAGNWTQEQFAAKLGVDARTVRRWENEEVIPRRRLLYQMKRLDPDDDRLAFEQVLLALSKTKDLCLGEMVDVVAKRNDGIMLFQTKYRVSERRAR